MAHRLSHSSCFSSPSWVLALVGHTTVTMPSSMMTTSLFTTALLLLVSVASLVWLCRAREPHHKSANELRKNLWILLGIHPKISSWLAFEVEQPTASSISFQWKVDIMRYTLRQILMLSLAIFITFYSHFQIKLDIL